MPTKTATNVMPPTKENKPIPNPGHDLFNLVRGGLIACGSNVRAWALSNGYSENTVRAALYGMSNSDEAKKIRARILRAAGIEDTKAA